MTQLKKRLCSSLTGVYHFSDRIACSASLNWQREVHASVLNMSFLPENLES